ncbi:MULTISPECIES: hypothetical protein [Streptomyces]|uniref:hypothetical protein n=1 Tax=Streptomyces TaxID=1883 RepID=UPI001BE827D6|nr:MULTISPECIES: hypothetical protein [unclassified Streptomyces]MBT2544546.1 hypothetical protein [Streptomyces sp. ISL-44]MCZ4086215.1 hypothetical protein [Streptomyces sp. H34-S5]
MSPIQANPAETQAMPRTALVSLVAAVAEDPKALASSVKASVQRSQEDANSCMMGGWVS